MRRKYITENALLKRERGRERKKAKEKRRKTVAVPTTLESFRH